MANLTTAAGDNGVAGNVNFATRTVTGAYASTYGDNGNLAVSDNHAVRRSVARTSRSAPTTASGVLLLSSKCHLKKRSSSKLEFTQEQNSCYSSNPREVLTIPWHLSRRENK